MCVFLGSMCLKLLLRDDFERLIWCLDHWLSCMLDCIHVYVFLFSKKLILKASSTSGYLLSFQAFSYCNLNTSSTPCGSIEKVLVPLIASQHLVDQSSLISCVWCCCTSTLAWHLYLSMAKSSTPSSTPLDLLRSFCMHCFSHVLHISFVLSSIASCFITFMHLYGFFVPPSSSLIIFIFLGWSFLASTPFVNHDKKGEKLENMFFHFKIIYVKGRNTYLCKGELCFILLGGVLTSFFLYLRSCDHYWHTLYLSSLYVDVYFSFTYPLHVLFLFSLYAYASYYLYAIYYFCFTQRCIDQFCLKCFRNTGYPSLLVINSLLAKFFKSLC